MFSGPLPAHSENHECASANNPRPQLPAGTACVRCRFPPRTRASIAVPVWIKGGRKLSRMTFFPAATDTGTRIERRPAPHSGEWPSRRARTCFIVWCSCLVSMPATKVVVLNDTNCYKHRYVVILTPCGFGNPPAFGHCGASGCRAAGRLIIAPVFGSSLKALAVGYPGLATMISDHCK